MAHVTADRVRDTSTTTGTGNITVSGTAPTGFRTFSAVLSVNDTFYYAIQSQGANEWEVGLGTYSSANVFARTTVLASSNSGSAVNFSAGTKDVFITLAAARTVQQDASENVGIGTTAPAVRLHAVTSTATTNAVTQVLRVDSQSTGTPAAGIGVGIQFATETAANNTEIGATIEAITTDVTSASEDFDLSFKTMAAGATAAERMRLTSTGNLQFNSGYGSVATAYGVRAWVTFNGTGTVAINGSGNVSSITDSNTGRFIVNFTNSFPDANYSVVGTNNARDATTCRFITQVQGTTAGGPSNKTTSACGIITTDTGASTPTDVASVDVMFFR